MASAPVQLYGELLRRVVTFLKLTDELGATLQCLSLGFKLWPNLPDGN
jgi:hypothetical protein